MLGSKKKNRYGLTSCFVGPWQEFSRKDCLTLLSLNLKPRIRLYRAPVQNTLVTVVWGTVNLLTAKPPSKPSTVEPRDLVGNELGFTNPSSQQSELGTRKAITFQARCCCYICSTRNTNSQECTRAASGMPKRHLSSQLLTVVSPGPIKFLVNVN